MDIKISHNWLKEYLQTKATPKQIAEELSLSGPSVEKISKKGNDYIYDIEITTNRVDCMSILGIAREASAILPNTKFIEHKNKKIKQENSKDLLHIKIDPKLVNRVMAIVMEVENGESPKLIKERLETAGMRSLNKIVDITNYIMQETGHPAHVFDYDAVASFAYNKIPSMIFRPSDKGEELVSFDGKEYKLPGDDIVIDDGEGNIIDLPGIIGTKNSVVNKDTKRIIFFIDNNDPLRIRRTSTRLGIRTVAAVLNEKGVDPELATVAFYKGIELYKNICKAKVISKIYDIYPKKYKAKTIKVEHGFIEKIIGVTLSSTKVSEILGKLGFDTKFNSKSSLYLVKAPSSRANDVNIPEDIVEEVARIYGYHNLPSEIMTGKLPRPLLNTPFSFENKIRNILKGYGGAEIYTSSLVPKDYLNKNALSLKNPLGEDTRYLRTTLKPLLINAVKENSREKEPFYFFEISNIYIPQKNDLPNEIMTLGIAFSNFSYRKAKGIVESLFDELNIQYNFDLQIINDSSYIYLETNIQELKEKSKDFKTYEPIPKYPPQIEDVTLTFPEGIKVGQIAKVIESTPFVKGYDLQGIYEGNFTFRIYYQNPDGNLTDEEVDKIRNGFLKEIRDKFGGVIKG
jgi:phenylalanyl-tRNA synthetase beta chain